MSVRRAVIMVWDGMRPDLISPHLTPHLAHLATEGVRFLDSHAVFPTVTRVNSASLATGALPGGHGIVGNSLYAPLVDPTAPISIGDHRSLYALIKTRGGRLLPLDTLADRVSSAGGRTVVVSSGSPGSAFLCHPRVLEFPDDRLYNPAIMLPETALVELERRFGPIPAPTIPNTAQNAYFSRVVTEFVLPELEPRLLIYWHNDPDKTQHHRGFGSPEALAAIRDADTHLGRLLAALETRGWRDETVIVVASDHGYVALDATFEPTTPLAAAGLRDELAAGRLVLATNGCALFVNVPGGEARLVRRVAEALLAWDHGGPVFSGARGLEPVEGTLPLALADLDGELAPDVLCALRWDDAANQHGHPGRSVGFDARYAASHGGISPWEVRNTLVLAGAGVKAGLEDPLPAGNLDVAPTLLHLLGLEPSPGQQGRVLAEALADGPDPSAFAVHHETVVAEWDTCRQHLRFSRVGAGRYLDFGWVERRRGG